MRVSVVRKKYPEFFKTVEATSWDETEQIDKSGRCMSSGWRRRVAYNTAAIATLELHKIIVASRKKITAKKRKAAHNKQMKKKARKCTLKTR